MAGPVEVVFTINAINKIGMKQTGKSKMAKHK